jgi:hypothetical protein
MEQDDKPKPFTSEILHIMATDMDRSIRHIEKIQQQSVKEERKYWRLFN